MYRFLSLFLLFLLLFLNTCSQDEPILDPRRVIVATIDNIEVSETSFQRAYLPVLLYGDKFDSEKNREEMLNFLIGQKLLAQIARDADLDTNTQIQRMRVLVERKAMSRQLYQNWVRDKMQAPTEAELREGFKRGRKAIFLRHLFAETEAEIRTYAPLLDSGQETFYTLAQDVFSDTLLSRNGGALGWITFGDLDETLEDTAYALKPGKISQPVKSQYGWHILMVDDTQEDVFVTEKDFLENRELIRKKIIERRENLLGKQVLNDFMQQFKIEFNREITKHAWPAVIAHLNPENPGPLRNTEFSAIVSDLDVIKQETLLEVNGEAWSVADILQRLPELDRSLLYGNLYIAASNIIRDEMLAREARRLSMDVHPDVKEEVQDSQDQILADSYVRLIADTLVFSGSTQKSYYGKHKLHRYHAPDSLLIETFAFADSLAASKALYQLRSGNVATYPGSESLWLGISQQETPIYIIARSISTGTLAGPVLFKNKWTIVKLLERHRAPLEFENIKARVLSDMEQDRFNTTRGILLDGIRPKHDISINYELLNR